METKEWIHRLTRGDGTVSETRARPARDGQPCFAGISQALARRTDPGATVVHLIRIGGEWRAPR